MNVVPIETRTPADAAGRGEPALALVPQLAAGQKALQLLKEARTMSLEHLKALQAAIGAVRELSDGVVESGELYGPGLNDFARRLSEELLWRGKTLDALIERQRDSITH
jgi:hypothetical protein